ncbi:hypothetical protein [Paraburkholderia bonniea]|uniref:hypothetical protein n=1 Tax=Paraburkholderia bonniea TaxID=2152891 RepID=UPI001291FFCB|nr:hypothetical protein [Paraburkholderia bonniea]
MTDISSNKKISLNSSANGNAQISNHGGSMVVNGVVKTISTVSPKNPVTLCSFHLSKALTSGGVSISSGEKIPFRERVIYTHKLINKTMENMVLKKLIIDHLISIGNESILNALFDICSGEIGELPDPFYPDRKILDRLKKEKNYPAGDSWRVNLFLNPAYKINPDNENYWMCALRELRNLQGGIVSAAVAEISELHYPESQLTSPGLSSGDELYDKRDSIISRLKNTLNYYRNAVLPLGLIRKDDVLFDIRKINSLFSLPPEAGEPIKGDLVIEGDIGIYGKDLNFDNSAYSSITIIDRPGRDGRKRNYDLLDCKKITQIKILGDCDIYDLGILEKLKNNNTIKEVTLAHTVNGLAAPGLHKAIMGMKALEKVIIFPRYSLITGDAQKNQNHFDFLFGNKNIINLEISFFNNDNSIFDSFTKNLPARKINQSIKFLTLKIRSPIPEKLDLRQFDFSRFSKFDALTIELPNVARFNDLDILLKIKTLKILKLEKGPALSIANPKSREEDLGLINQSIANMPNVLAASFQRKNDILKKWPDMKPYADLLAPEFNLVVSFDNRSPLIIHLNGAGTKE